MSFNATDKSGIVEPVEITDFLQFLPGIGGSIGLGIGQIFTQILKPASTSFTKNYVATTGTKTTGNILSKFIKPAVTQVTKKATIPTNLLSKTNVITGGILGTTLASTLFLSSPQGQNTVNVAGQGVSDVTNLGKSVNDLFNKNPLIPIGLLVLGGLIVVSVIKK